MREGTSEADVRAPSRRHVLRGAAAATGGGALGVTSLLLPGAAASASEHTVEVSGVSLVLHLDASSPGPASATTWQDLSGSGNAGTVGPDVTHVAAAGATPAHYRFPGTSSAAVITAGGGLAVVPGAPPTAYTKMLWFRRDTVTRYDNLLSSTGSSTYETHFLFFSISATPQYQRLTAGHASSGFTRLFGGIDVEAGIWTFGAVSFSTTTGYALYTNTSDRDWGEGTITTSPYGAQDALTKPLSLQIGGIGGLHTLQGDLATVVMHSRALTDEEVRAYYASTVDRFHA